jgi:hypothetical protein
LAIVSGHVKGPVLGLDEFAQPPEDGDEDLVHVQGGSHGLADFNARKQLTIVEVHGWCPDKERTAGEESSPRRMVLCFSRARLGETPATLSW